jgi:hypothetical protein
LDGGRSEGRGGIGTPGASVAVIGRGSTVGAGRGPDPRFRP